jgi:hypothetical protein
MTKGALAAIDMALLRSFANRFKAPTHAQKRNEAFHEPLQFERCCGWVLPARGNPTQPRSVEEPSQCMREAKRGSPLRFSAALQMMRVPAAPLRKCH